jgi:hypothetical protein
MRAWGCLAAGALFALATPAFGAENERAWSTPFVIGVRLEALPTLFEGFHGVTVEVAPSRFVSVELGGGFWFYGPAGLSTLHLQIPIGRAGIGLEAGLLTGSFTFSDCQYDVTGGGVAGTTSRSWRTGMPSAPRFATRSSRASVRRSRGAPPAAGSKCASSRGRRRS